MSAQQQAKKKRTFIGRGCPYPQMPFLVDEVFTSGGEFYRVLDGCEWDRPPVTETCAGPVSYPAHPVESVA